MDSIADYSGRLRSRRQMLGKLVALALCASLTACSQNPSPDPSISPPKFDTKIVRDFSVAAILFLGGTGSVPASPTATEKQIIADNKAGSQTVGEFKVARVFPSHGQAMTYRLDYDKPLAKLYGEQRLLVAVAVHGELKQASPSAPSPVYALLVQGRQQLPAALSKEQQLFIEANRPRQEESGNPIAPTKSPIREYGNTELTVSPIADPTALSKGEVKEGYQDGGNGSGGGDASSFTHYVDSISSASSITFWKLDGPYVSGALKQPYAPLPASKSTVTMLNSSTSAVNFARVFQTEAEAKKYQMDNSRLLVDLFKDTGRIVPVAILDAIPKPPVK